jgi:hypothetical protein
MQWGIHLSLDDIAWADVTTSSQAHQRNNPFPQNVTVAIRRAGHILPPASKSSTLRLPPMNKTAEVLLTVLALVGLFCASTKNAPIKLSTQHSVVVADGSAPMPICRRKRCF